MYGSSLFSNNFDRTSQKMQILVIVKIQFVVLIELPLPA